MIQLNCAYCNQPFEKTLKSYNRNQKCGRRSFCSCGCASKAYTTLTESKAVIKERFKKYQQVGRKTNELSPFRCYMGWIRQRKLGRKSKPKDCDFDEQYLKELWEGQNGVCPYTGIKMSLRRGVIHTERSEGPTVASVDRIDSAFGYIKGNVEFVCLSINLAKNGFSRDQMRKFIEQIKSP